MEEEIIIEREVEYYDSGGTITKANVKVTPTRLLIERGKRLESVLIRHINVLKLYRDDKWSYLAVGLSLILFGVIFLFLVPSIKGTIILETPFKEILGAIALFVGIPLIFTWLLYRRFILQINSFGYVLNLMSRRERPLKDVYDTMVLTP